MIRYHVLVSVSPVMMQDEHEGDRPLNKRVLQVEEAKHGDDHPNYLSKPEEFGGDSREARKSKGVAVRFVPV